MKRFATKYSWRGTVVLSLAIIALSFVVINFSESSSAATVDLTGVWKGDDGATYYIRHVPRMSSMMQSINGVSVEVKDDIYWYGQGKGFGNVFHGTINKGQVNQIGGEWADVPIGPAKNNGKLKITIASKDRLVLMGEPGNFGAREWKRAKLASPNQNLPNLKSSPD